MSPLAVAILALAAFVIAYRFYARHLALRLFELDATRPTPAHRLRDDLDYVPANRYVLFGHQYASITGLSPMLGPAIAVIWGWLPATLWVVIGAVFVACKISVRSLSIRLDRQDHREPGRHPGDVVSPHHLLPDRTGHGCLRAHLATLFSDFYPESVLPSSLLIVVAITLGWGCIGALGTRPLTWLDSSRW